MEQMPAQGQARTAGWQRPRTLSSLENEKAHAMPPPRVEITRDRWRRADFALPAGPWPPPWGAS